MRSVQAGRGDICSSGVPDTFTPIDYLITLTTYRCFVTNSSRATPWPKVAHSLGEIIERAPSGVEADELSSPPPTTTMHRCSHAQGFRVTPSRALDQQGFADDRSSQRTQLS